jgi:two-component system response regulator AtoC
MNILIVDDEAQSCEALAGFVEKLGGQNVFTCTDSRDATRLAGERQIDLIVTDVRMPHVSGVQIAQEIRHLRPACEVVLISGQSDVIESINAIDLGVFDFLKKPVEVVQLAALIQEIEKKKRHTGVESPSLPTLFNQDVINLSDLAVPPDGIFVKGPSGPVVMAAEAMMSIYKKLKKLQEYPDIPVFIEGRTGTGKEIIAKLIHDETMGPEKPFVGINCAAIGKDLFESELFGYVKGAFTGADPGGKEGKIALAEGGSLFLDEIAEISPDLQIKLLRVLQEKEYFPVGSNQRKRVNARIICATNRNVKRMIRDGTFREDLYFRLDVCKVSIPSLKKRREDIIPLAVTFIKELNERKTNPVTSIEGRALKLLYEHDWPGNVRQLKNSLTRAILFNDSGTLKERDFDFLTKKKAVGPNKLNPDDFLLPDKPFRLDDFIDEIIRKTLARFGGNKTKSAEFLGLNRLQLYNRYRRNIDSNHEKSE